MYKSRLRFIAIMGNVYVEKVKENTFDYLRLIRLLCKL